jgi:hypothetical protein
MPIQGAQEYFISAVPSGCYEYERTKNMKKVEWVGLGQ